MRTFVCNVLYCSMESSFNIRTSKHSKLNHKLDKSNLKSKRADFHCYCTLGSVLRQLQSTIMIIIPYQSNINLVLTINISLMQFHL